MTSGQKNRNEAERYVRNQEEHHRRSTIQDEYRTLLGVDNDQPPRSTGWRLSAERSSCLVIVKGQSPSVA